MGEQSNRTNVFHKRHPLTPCWATVILMKKKKDWSAEKLFKKVIASSPSPAFPVRENGRKHSEWVLLSLSHISGNLETDADWARKVPGIGFVFTENQIYRLSNEVLGPKTYHLPGKPLKLRQNSLLIHLWSVTRTWSHRTLPSNNLTGMAQGPLL